MKVELLQSRVTATGAQDRGEQVEVSTEEGARMIEAGQAKPVRAAKVQFASKAKTAETAVK